MLDGRSGGVGYYLPTSDGSRVSSLAFEERACSLRGPVRWTNRSAQSLVRHSNAVCFEDERRAQTPFVRSPFPDMPGSIDLAQPEKAMQGPTLWAALHLAAQRPDGAQPSVLISVTHGAARQVHRQVSRPSRSLLCHVVGD